MAENDRTQDLSIRGIIARHIRIFGQNDEPLNVDALSGGMLMQENYHYRIHKQQAFTVNELSLSLANDADITLALLTANKQPCHMFPTAIAGGDAEFRLTEAPTLSNNGTAQTVFNRFRSSSRTAHTQVFLAPTITDEGTILDAHLIPGGSGGAASGGHGNLEQEWVLKTNTLYLIRLFNRAGTAQPGHVQLDFYEPLNVG